MTEETTAPETKSTSRKFILPVILVILLIGGLGYVASKAGLDKALVKQAVDHFAADLAASTEHAPAHMTLTYDDIRLEGGLTNRHAILVNPAIKEVSRRDQSVTHYRTDEVALYPTSTDLTSLRLEIAKPVRVFRADETLAAATITQRSAIIVNVGPETRGDKNYTITTVALPDAFLIDAHPDNITDPWNRLTLTLAPGATMKRSMIEGGADWTSLSDSSFTAKDIKITPDAKPADAVTIASIDTSFTNTLNEQNLNHVTLNANIGPIDSSDELLPYGPLTAIIELDFEGVLRRSPEAFAEAKSNESSLKLETFSIKGKDAAIYATADFVSGATDVLPVGTANLTVENLPFVLGELRAREKLKPQEEQILAAVIQRATGKKLGDTTDLTIDIKRVRDGAFQIGDTTFEEVMALVLKGALSGKMDAPTEAPVGAPAEEPVTTPVETPAPIIEKPLDTSPGATAPAPDMPVDTMPLAPTTDTPKEDIVPDTRG